MAPAPTIGRIVIFRSRTGKYEVPAIVTATGETLAPEGVAAFEASGGEKGVPPLTGEQHVHLTVLTPGLPGQRGSAEDFEVQSAHPVQENVGGTYQEWDVPPDHDPFTGQLPGTWRWPARV